MKYSLRALAFLVVLACTACSFSKSDRDYNRLTREFIQKSPHQEAAADYAAGDYRILSAMGYGTYYPGLEIDVGKRIASKYGVRMIDGTTDAPESKAQARYVAATIDFAERYNKRKVALLRMSPKEKSSSESR
ncbi:hypothetical protein JIN85_19105 [Luteolibacter pohnpeiensis]|uniref:DUF4810 domain-containing protein n=1 Tax=Luteolibacter pohnpeiensis TaxID=454153 RepID=A0A934S9X9_9BACT|nr:hypothetical protein [Luteolibacter pohnpeiensis]MBK1884533.1 hypothetical protein [Luteolibacter pohnpeiensis]